MFLDDRERALHVNWDRAATNIVASFRASIGARTDDQRAVQLVGELSLASPEFRKLWARHDVLNHVFDVDDPTAMFRTEFARRARA